MWLAPRAGLEPATFRLTAERSTIELPGSAQAALGGSLTKAPNSVKEAHENEKKMAGVEAWEITDQARADSPTFTAIPILMLRAGRTTKNQPKFH